MTVLVLGDKVLKPLLAASTETYAAHGKAIRARMQGVFRELGVAA